MLFMIFGAMLLAGALTVCWPLYRHARRLTTGMAVAALAVIAVSTGLYTVIGTPHPPSAQSAMPSVEDMVTSLEQRLLQNPEDVAGWKMLGRSFIQLQQYDKAVDAYENALAREGDNNGQTLADLAEAVLLASGESVSGRSSELFEAALAAAPNNPKALFYGGVAAIERGDRALAADRWEALLALAPPPDVQEILRLRIAEWRGEPAAAGEATVTVSIGIADDAAAALSADTSVFVIARDPAQPSPPIAAVRRQAGELPASVTLSNADSMIPGRLLSQFDELEIVVRASLSGQPVESSGDWYGTAQVDRRSTNTVDVVINRQVE